MLAACLSFVPGAGHWVLGKRKKAAALFVVDAGVLCSLLFLKSIQGRGLACFGYLMTMIPAVIETHALASGKISGFSNSKAYIVLMLLKEGFSALPLLWQSDAFSKQVKIGWSIVVPLLAISYVMLLILFEMSFAVHAKS